MIDGNSNIGAGKYMSVVQNNSMVACNQGGAGAIYGINIQQATGAGAYPTASNKIITEGNHTDATVKINTLSQSRSCLHGTLRRLNS